MAAANADARVIRALQQLEKLHKCSSVIGLHPVCHGCALATRCHAARGSLKQGQVYPSPWTALALLSDGLVHAPVLACMHVCKQVAPIWLTDAASLCVCDARAGAGSRNTIQTVRLPGQANAAIVRTLAISPVRRAPCAC